MKKKILLLLLAAALALGAAGCDEAGTSQSDTIPETSATTAQTTQTESTAEPIKYNGTFNDEVFNQIVQNIKIGDKTISLPCTLEDFGEGYTYAENTTYLKEQEIMSCTILDVEEETVATVSFKCKEEDKNLRDNEINSISFSVYDYLYNTNNRELFIGNLTFNSNKNNALMDLGEPSKFKEYDNGSSRFYYETSSGGYLCFDFDDSNQIIQMNISSKTY